MQTILHKYIRLRLVSITDILYFKLHKYYINLPKVIRLR